MQHERATWRVESARTIRNKQWKYLADCIKRHAAINVIFYGNFNECVSSETIKYFMNETGPHDVFAEINGAETENREVICQHGRKCINCTLTTEGTLMNVTGIGLIECSDIVKSDHSIDF